MTTSSMEQDKYFNAESAPPTLRDLANMIRHHFNVPAGNVGMIGDVHHRDGYHRSRAFILHSPLCTNHGYSVVETPGNVHGGYDTWVSAIDIQLPTSILLTVCKRLDVAVRAGHAEAVTEWYGNINGDKVVDGYDNVHNRVASSDPSHLWHLHISIDRGAVGKDLTWLFNILAGVVPPAPEVPPAPATPPAPPQPTLNAADLSLITAAFTSAVSALLAGAQGRTAASVASNEADAPDQPTLPLDGVQPADSATEEVPPQPAEATDQGAPGEA